MHGSVDRVETLSRGVLAGVADNDWADVAVFPPFPYLSQVAAILKGTALSWGGQDVSPHEQGAHTGEVSADMLTDLGCRMVLVGHSERRAMYGDSNSRVADKFIAAQAAGLVPVLCVGETLEQRRAAETESVVAGQIDAVIERAGIAALADAVIAYEPVWAIGTGQTASPAQAQEIHAFIRDKLAALDGTIADRLRILYGGSVKGANAAELFAQKDIDGGLIGGASLQAEDFLAIFEAARL